MIGRRLLLAILLFATLLGAICYFGFSLFQKSVSKTNVERLSPQDINAKSKNHLAFNNYKRSIFVPYWQLSGSNQPSDLGSQYDRYIYFGVAGTVDGVPTDDPGYEHMDGFLSMAKGSRWLTIRMTDSEVNDVVLSNKTSQIKVVNDSVRIAKEHGFDGLVLDFEQSGLFGTGEKEITSFYKLFNENAKLGNLKFAVTLYGDVFYRKRPYNVAEIAKNCDEVMIMAYDLHKSRGEPGPNFPLKAGKGYGYGYDALFRDIEKLVPAEKLTVIFGMYGYDWKVDEQKRPITQANSLTTAQIQKEYIDKCDSLNCTQLIDPISAETEINYVGADGRYHIIWFEDEESTQKKEAFLKQKGVESVAYWAYGYF